MFFYRDLTELAATDPYFANVSLLLRGSRTTTGAPTTLALLDDSNNNIEISRWGNTDVSLSTYKYGNSSIAFDGNGDYLTIPPNSAFSFGADNFTIEFWYRPSSTARQWFIHSTSDYWIGLDKDTDGKIGMWASSNGGSWNLVESDSSQGRSVNSVTLNTWHHIAFVRNGNDFMLFLNGNLEKTVTASGGIIDRSAQTKYIGRHPVGYYTYGHIDDFRVTKNVARYTANFTPPTSELTLSGDANAANVSLLLRGNRTTVLSTDALLDDSSNNVAISRFGNADVSLITYKYGNSSISFDGDGDYLTIPPNSAFSFGADNFTIEFWYRPSTTARHWFIHSTSDYWIGLDKDTDGRIGMWASSNGSSWNLVESDSSQGRSVNSVSLNTWYHIAFVRNGNNFMLFLNGNLEKTVTASGAIVDRSAQTKYIGRHPVGYYTYGHIDDFRVTKNVARYTANFTPPSAELPNS